MKATLPNVQAPSAEPVSSWKRFRRDVLQGLSRKPKTLPSKYLYDETGARLFEAICDLDEYYLTRTEASILRRNINEIAECLERPRQVIELGSGNSAKTRLLLDHLDSVSTYVPVDVSREQLLECADALVRDYPALEVCPVCADYTESFKIADLPSNGAGAVTLFLGSTIGNFDPGEAVQFLRRMRSICGMETELLVGADLHKNAMVLHRAYNDCQGVTAAFNSNLLARINRELQADFDLSAFTHHAFYNQRAGRIEMHLVSRERQNVSIGDREFWFEEGESIRTEVSYKYRPEDLAQLAAEAGLVVSRCWTDEKTAVQRATSDSPAGVTQSLGLAHKISDVTTQLTATQSANGPNPE